MGMRSQVQQFIWRQNGKNNVYQYYKVSLAIYLCTMTFYGWRDQKLNPKNVHGTHCYTDYVSNWADVICALWGLVSAHHALYPNETRLDKLRQGLNSIAPTWSIGVAGAFWCLLPKERQTLDLVSLHQHAFLAIVTFIDLVITNSQIQMKQIIPAWSFAALYAINTILVWLIFGEDRNEIYPMINYSEKFTDAVIFDLTLIFGVQSSVFLFLYTVSTFKKLFIPNSVPLSKLD